MLPSINFTNFSVPATTTSSGLLTLNGTISDTNSPSSISVTINWGDKTSSTVLASATSTPGIFAFSAGPHAYPNPPSSKSPFFTVTASAKDSTNASVKAIEAAVVADGLPGNETINVAPGNTSSVQVTVGSFTGSFSRPADGGPIVVFGSSSATAPDNITVNEGAAVNVAVYGGSQDPLTVQDPTPSDTITMTNNSVTANGSTVTYSGVSSLLVSGLGGGDSVTMTGIATGVPTTVDGVSGATSFAGQFGSAGFNGTLVLVNFAKATFSDAGSFTGSLTVKSPGSLQQFSVASTVTAGSTITATNISNVNIGTLAGHLTANGGSISGVNITSIAPGGVLQATESVGVPGSGVISNASIGTNSGSILAGAINGMFMGINSSSVRASGQGTINNFTDGTNTGTISAVEDSNVGSGVFSNGSIGDNSGSISAGAINQMSMGSNSGSVTASGQGTINNFTDGTNTGTISAVEDSNAGSGVFSNGSIGDNSGSISAGAINQMSMGSNSGSVTASGQGTISKLNVGTNSGLIQAKADTTSGSGALSNSNIGTLATTGIVSAANASDITITTVAGSIQVTNHVSNLSAGTVAGTANLHAGHFDVFTAQHAAPTVNFIEPTVTRTLMVSPHTGNTGNVLPDYGFYYDGTGPGDPKVVVQIVATSSTAPFDLGVTTSTATNSSPPPPNSSELDGFDLAGLYSVDSNGNPNALTGVHNVVVGGNVLLGAVPGALSFFNHLPSTAASGGIQLPQDIVAVAAAGNLPAASIVAKAVPSVAAGLFNGVSADNASQNDALVPLAVGTAVTQANDSFQVFVSEASHVAQFLVTGPGSSFDNKQMLFADQVADNLPVTATDTLVPTGSSATVSSVAFSGFGASLTTAQAITNSITVTAGSLGDLTLKAPQGLTASVTAPSIIGNINITNGGISNIIETSGDLGSTITGPSGSITGVTSIQTGSGGLTSTGQIIVGGNLISQVGLQSGLDGVIAVQGDIGTIQTSNGIAPNGALTRFGGINVSTGGVTGQIVAMGNVFGDISITGGLSGRIAVHGNNGEFGLSNGRDGILGNVSIKGGIDTTGAIVSGGLIGDAISGTHLSISGTDKGLLAAVGIINFGATGSLNQAGLFNNVGGTSTNGNVIDAIFTKSVGTLFQVISPGDLSQLLDLLIDLTYSPGHLIEPST
jgi:hypothetical protein